MAKTDKQKKKESGQYYTPNDVSAVMSKWLRTLPGENIVDVGCGTGNLILSYLNLIGKEEARRLIKDGRLYLYDLDEVALDICKYSIAIIYGEDLLEGINAINCDFLDKTISLPANSRVISNPPYAKITKKSNKWPQSKIIDDSNELYAAFFEKIIDQSISSVIISPYSFCGATKYYSLRKKLNRHSGFIVSFDNVPGNIFRGKKHGIFNTNHANSVRASITVTNDTDSEKGYRLTPLLRFNSSEREKLLDNKVLESFVGSLRQKVSEENQEYKKCSHELEGVLKNWESSQTETIFDLTQKVPNSFKLNIPTTCRYFCVASSKDLSRTGKHEIYAKNQECFDYLYAFINSSFLYWRWRMLDGGINLTGKLLFRTPTFYKKLNNAQKEKLHKLVNETVKQEGRYLVYKKNASALQENVKFPNVVRESFNKELLEVLKAKEKPPIFNALHSNCLFGAEGAGNE